jgi:Spy/CpxP family protein refolding chaperone
MRNLMLAALMVAVSVSPAFGQRQRQGQGRGFGGGMMGGVGLLANKAVQEDLKLTPEQAKAAQELAGKQRGEFQGLQNLSPEERREKMQELNKKNQEAIATLLKPEQQKRFKQLSLQAGGVMALAMNPEAAKEVGITDDQKEKLQTMQRESAVQMRELFQGGDFQEAAKKMAETRKTNNEKAMSLLTAEQKTKWKALTGEPFKGDLTAGGFGGGRGKRNKQ